MYSDDEKVVLCGASAYEQKYYFNQDFASLPQSVQDELHIMCVMFTVEIGGIFTMWQSAVRNRGCRCGCDVR